MRMAVKVLPELGGQVPEVGNPEYEHVLSPLRDMPCPDGKDFRGNLAFGLLPLASQ